MKPLIRELPRKLPIMIRHVRRIVKSVFLATVDASVVEIGGLIHVDPNPVPLNDFPPLLDVLYPPVSRNGIGKIGKVHGILRPYSSYMVDK